MVEDEEVEAVKANLHSSIENGDGQLALEGYLACSELDGEGVLVDFFEESAT